MDTKDFASGTCYKDGKEVVPVLGGQKINQMEYVDSAFVNRHTTLVERVTMVFKYPQTFVEEYGLPLLRAKTVDIGHMILSDFSYGMGASTYRWYVNLGKVLFTYMQLCKVVENLKQRISSSLCLGVSA